MKILHIIDSSGLYGAEIMLLNLMEEQRRMNLTPMLISLCDLDGRRSKKEGLNSLPIQDEKGVQSE
jgi:hypothetical protein